MRVGRKHTKAVDVRQTRSCVVRLEKVSTASPNVSPSLESRVLTRTHRLSSTSMVSTPKTRRGVNLQREEIHKSGASTKKSASGGTNTHGLMQTTQHQKAPNTTVQNVKSSQKIKVVAKANKETSVPIPSKEESPPPTIAAGRSRRAIKPNPKYASEDLVTPKVVRNVGLFGSNAGKGSTVVQNKTRKASTSSDDFYNRNSEDDSNIKNADNDSHNDKAYQASEKDDNDSDFSVVEESSKRSSRLRSRPKRNQETSLALTSQLDNKLPTQTRSTTTTTTNSSNFRSAPSQLQQIRRSLANANAQRSFNLLTSSNVGSAQKRKVEEILDSSDTESNYSLKRKHLEQTNSLTNKIKLPVKEHKMSATSTPLNKNRLNAQIQNQKPVSQPALNGSYKINSLLASSRRAIESAVKPNSEIINKSSTKQTVSSTTMVQQNKTSGQNSATTQPKILSSKTQKLRSASPKQTVQKEKQSNNGAIVSLSSAPSNPSASSKIDSKVSEKVKAFNMNPITKPKISIAPHNISAIRPEIVHEIKDDSPNSTMDDFETMPTFTIVNVNDIINKKGDVLITKSKSNSNRSHTVIELSESISLDDDDDDDDEDNISSKDDDEDVMSVLSASSRQKQVSSKTLSKPQPLQTKNESESKKSIMAQSGEQRKLPTLPPASTIGHKQAPQILNHRLGLRNTRVAAKTTTTITATLTSPDKPAPRILNSVVAKKTQPVKPMIANMDDSADESFPLSLDEDEDAEGETEDERESKNSTSLIMSERPRRRDYHNLMQVDTEDTESQNTEDDDKILQPTKTTHAKLSPKAVALAPRQNSYQQRRERTVAHSNNQIIVSNNQKRLTPAAAKENCLAATNQQVNDINTKQPTAPTLPVRKTNTEKVVISKQGDKIIKKITCFETWYVINMPADVKRPVVMKNQLEMPLVQLANHAKNICLPNNMWSSKVTLYELSPQSLIKGTYATFTGDLHEHNISEEDRGKYQPSCVMFRRSIEKSLQSRMPYDRAVIFKNKTFYTNIEGKNIRLLGAPSIINCESEIEILLEIVDSMNLQSDFVELVSVMQ